MAIVLAKSCTSVTYKSVSVAVGRLCTIAFVRMEVCLGECTSEALQISDTHQQPVPPSALIWAEAAAGSHKLCTRAKMDHAGGSRARSSETGARGCWANYVMTPSPPSVPYSGADVPEQGRHSEVVTSYSAAQATAPKCGVKRKGSPECIMTPGQMEPEAEAAAALTWLKLRSTAVHANGSDGLGASRQVQTGVAFENLRVAGQLDQFSKEARWALWHGRTSAHRASIFATQWLRAVVVGQGRCAPKRCAHI